MELSRTKKIDQLALFKRECKRFFSEIYHDTEKILVFGEGDVDASLVLVGEAPGEQETIQQRPFVGKAGKNLDEFLEVLNMDREKIYITNVVKFRPFKVNEKTGRLSNRPPTREEIELSRPWLIRELGIIEPKVIVSLGNTALKTLSGRKDIKIGDMHGDPFSIELGDDGKTANLFPLYHPASIIYRRELAKVYREDLEALNAYMANLAWT